LELLADIGPGVNRRHRERLVQCPRCEGPALLRLLEGT
jgi:hypothetical protein